MAGLHGFELVDERTIAELKIQASLYRHVKTGAQLLSIVADDENKTFNITFRTPPADSTGVAHILEHSVLCGSRKYPLKEPFIELVKGSMKTFVNAMTGGEATYYPVASTNLKDFYNLIDVYLDAVLYPLLTEHTFHQEGWRYELEAPDGDMIYKGIVFNEMKGYYASPDTLLGNYSQSAMMPDTIYAHDSGGNPAEIPDLTYQGLVDFHRCYYHPSNARILFYGDDPPEERLRLMDQWLSDFEPRQIDSKVKPQPRFDAPRTVVAHYPVGDETNDTKKSHLVINWLIEGGLDPITALSYDVLAYILLQTPASVIRKALMDSGLGDKVMGGLDDGPQMHFYAGMKGIEVGEEPEVEAFILDELKRAAEGIDPEMVEAALNTLEFRLRENNTGSFPRGLAIGFRALQSWIFDGDPFESMEFESRLQVVKELASKGGYFERLLREGILANEHRVTVVLQPDPAMTERLNGTEVERVASERQAMSPERIAEIVEETHELRRLQETPDSPEDLAKIPTLTLADLDKQNKLIPTEILNEHPATVLHHDLFTNGVVYLDLGFDLHALPFELLKYVPLFGASLLQLGTQSQDYVRLIQRIGQKTGGIWTQNVNSAVRGSDIAASWFFLRAKALPGQVPDLFDILHDILLTVNLDNQERFRQLVLESKAGYESALTQPAAFVGPRLQSRFGEAGAASEQMTGVTYYFFLKDLIGLVDSDWPSVLKELDRIKQTLLNRGSMVVNVTVESSTFDSLQPRLDAFLSAIPSASRHARSLWPKVGGPRHEGLTVPTQVNAIGVGADLFSAGYEYHGSVSPISKYLRTTWIWEQVRMKGGAYGGACGFDARNGIFTFSSSQDPNLLSTLEVFARTGDYLRQAPLDRAEITRSVIGAISDMDFYQLPDAKGYTALLRYLVREDDEYRQKVRDEVLDTDVRHFRDFANALDASIGAQNIVAFGPASAFDVKFGESGFETVAVL